MKNNLLTLNIFDSKLVIKLVPDWTQKLEFENGQNREVVLKVDKIINLPARRDLS